MKKQIILKGKTNKKAVNENSKLSLNLEQTIGVLPTDDILGRVDSYSVYEKEARNSNKFRLTIDIVPFCTNVLFNSVTEIVKDEGSNNITILNNNVGIAAPSVATSNKPLLQKQAIKNTEYSNSECGFVYHCGLDILNNHILRNYTFNMVNPTLNDSKLDVFNSILDFSRDRKGNPIKEPLISVVNAISFIDAKNKLIDTHLYQYEDLMDFETSVAENLIEKDGWIGFTNISKPSPNKMGNRKYNMVLNANKPCEFIDMYPDRSLFSFSPKYNKYRKRFEYNWNYCVTYPYKQERTALTEFVLDKRTITGDRIKKSGLQLIGFFFNGDNVCFRCPTNHGLSVGDNVILYFGITASVMNRVDTPLSIVKLGDINGKSKGYVFQIDKRHLDNFNFFTTNNKFRFSRFVNGSESEYYHRLFRKLPNFKFSSEQVTSNLLKDEAFLNENTIQFQSNINKLAFAKTVYGDDVSQIVFTDDIDVSHLTDHLGRPLTELYVTLIKNNKGYEKWYKNNETVINDDGGDIEYSHAFGAITSGFNLPYESEFNGEYYNNVKRLHNVNVANIPKSSTPIERDITIEQTLFNGDLVSFNVNELREQILEPVYHRFNSGQRETNNQNFSTFYVDELKADDYDKQGFKVDEVRLNYEGAQKNYDININPEGYFYKPHQQIELRGFSDIINSGIREKIALSREIKAQEGEWLIETPTNYYMAKGDNVSVVLIDRGRDYIVEECIVTQVITKTKFKIREPYEINLNSTTATRIIFRKQNIDIPTYAINTMDGSGRYIWREVVSPIDSKVKVNKDKVFANGAFYINKKVNFYVRRQDPHNKCQLRDFNDLRLLVKGHKTIDVTNYEYQNENENTQC